MDHFADRLFAACRKTGSVAVVGLDPRLEMIPPAFKDDDDPAGALLRFNLAILDGVAGLVPAVKPNIAFYEAFGAAGLRAYLDTCRAAHERGLLVIGDIKRGDIGSTAAAYAAAHLGGEDCPHDAITVNAFAGSDGVMPFVDKAAETGRGLFVWVRGSNPSSAELQDLPVAGGGTVAEKLADRVSAWGGAHGGESGMSLVGAVVGATQAEMLAAYRAMLPRAWLLLPGYGSQGATGADVVGGFTDDGAGALVAASRSVCFAFRSGDGGDDAGPAQVADAARQSVTAMNDDINTALAAAGKSLPG